MFRMDHLVCQFLEARGYRATLKHFSQDQNAARLLDLFEKYKRSTESNEKSKVRSKLSFEVSRTQFLNFI